VTPRNRIFAIVIAAVFVALILARLTAGFLVDWTWFGSLGFAGVFWTTVKAKIAVFFTAFGPSAIIFYVNAAIAQKLSGFRPQLRSVTSPWNAIPGITPPVLLERLYRSFPWQRAIVAVSLFLALLIAASEIGNWSVALRYVYQVPYGQTESLFGQDIGFYLFSLPAYVALKDWLLFTLVIAGLMAAVLYWVHGAILFDQQRRFIAPVVVAHGSVLLGLWLLVKAFDYWLQRFQLVYGDNGVVVGASYTDVHLQIPILWALVVLALAGAAVSFAGLRGRSLKHPVLALAALLAVSMVVAPVLNGLYERFYVAPNQLQFESPYIARNIAMTREAYDLGNIEQKPFVADENLTAAALTANRPTIENIRLWDYKPLLASYSQLQEIRTYYKFNDADVDRYWLDGKYQQVMTTAREFDATQLPPNAQTWVNLHVLYTHGNGVVMSPVTKTETGGLPSLYIKDIPPVSEGGPKVSEPRIYFGEGADTYVIVKSSEKEFDYPKGDNNVYAAYQGKDGVAIGGFGPRLLFSYYFGDINILLSNMVTSESRIMFRRNIQQRIGEIAPFLTLDADPYIVVSNGKLYWMQDAYTVSDAFPYSKRAENGHGNYIRNSVKVVIDAYDGTVSFYIADQADPLIKTYARIFPGLFQPLTAMPADLKRHIRYPEDFFAVQAQMYASYHMDAPEVFFSREDQWQFPKTPASDDNGEGKMAPYYLNMRLPGAKSTEFVLMLPMVPRQKENMIAWLAARCDPEHYGKLIVYTFPKDKLIYGPFQINALINQNTEVSQQITLWNQSGSRVIHGNLLVVPIDNSVLYVMPLYLRAASGQLPELKRVIAVYDNKVAMEETLGQALAKLFQAPDGSFDVGGAPSAAATAPAQAAATAVLAAVPASAAKGALDHYNKAIAKLKAGDWAGFGAELDAMKPLLEDLNKAKPAAAK
jgi:uncharacterized membrane protein (UPF0182 family)